MVYAKIDLFDYKLQQCAGLFKALAHPARLQILKYLASINTCFSGNISDELPLSRTTVNQHLSELKKAGLILGTVDGARTNYCLNPEKINELKELFDFFISEINTTENYKCE